MAFSASIPSKRWELPILCVLCVLLSTTAAFAADPNAADKETARSLMQEGRDLRDKGDAKGALQRFQGANGIMHVPTTALEVARTQVALGLLVEARDTVASIRLMPAAGGEPPQFKEARDKADELDASLEGRIPALTIVVRGAAEEAAPELAIDGVQVPPAAAALPQRVDAGHHLVVAKTRGATAQQEVDVTEGEQKKIELTLVATGETSSATPEESPFEPPPPPPPPPQAPPAPATSHSPTSLTYAGFGVGGLGLVVGAIAGGLSWSKTSSLSGECNATKRCAGQGASDYDTAKTLALVSNVGFAVAVAGAAVGVVSLVVGHPSDRNAAQAPPARVEAWVGPGSAGLRGSF